MKRITFPEFSVHNNAALIKASPVIQQDVPGAQMSRIQVTVVQALCVFLLYIPPICIELQLFKKTFMQMFK